MTFTGTRLLAASPSYVLASLVDVRRLSTWNPALAPVRSADEQAVVGRVYRTKVKGLVPATIVFDRIAEGGLEYEMNALRSGEIGRWSWKAEATGCTRVTHSFEHRGVLLGAIPHAFDQVAGWRLDRLAEEAARRAHLAERT